MKSASSAWDVWRHARRGERLHHAWLLTGPPEAAKAEFAEAAARDLVGASGSQHPDILLLSPGPKDDKEEHKRQEGKPYQSARSIRVAQVRAVQARLTTRPTLGAWRAIIVDPADGLERSAANALLKSLEEPPAGTVFFLLADNAARLLPTIRSRCRTLRFPHRTGTSPDETVIRTAASALLAGDPSAALAIAAAFSPRPDPETARNLFADIREAVDALAISSLALREAASLADMVAKIDRFAAEHDQFNYDPGLLGEAIVDLLGPHAPASAMRDG